MQSRPFHRHVYRRISGLLIVLVCAAPILFLPARACVAETVVLASTTSTENSGLLRYLLPRFEAQSGVRVNVVAVGTGQALRLAERGDADVLLVHHRPSEERFVAQGFGVQRYPLMHNDFVIVGPRSDAAGIQGHTSFSAALERIRQGRHPFISRGDDSGTHKRELALWQTLDAPLTRADADWYLEAGAGMGATLNTAVQLNAYCLTDRSTWIKFFNKGAHTMLAEGDALAANPYGVILVNPRRHPHVRAEAGQRLIDWLTSPEGQALIAGYRVAGEQLFFPHVDTVADGETLDTPFVGHGS